MTPFAVRYARLSRPVQIYEFVIKNAMLPLIRTPGWKPPVDASLQIQDEHTTFASPGG